MTFAVAPLGEEETFYSIIKPLMYVLVSTLSGALFGFFISTTFYLAVIGISEATKLVLLLGLVFVYLLKGLGYIYVPHPQRKWQIPSPWVEQNSIFTMTVWGAILGAGLFTYNPNVHFWLKYVYIGFFLQPIIGLLIGGIYGLARALPSIYFGFVYVRSSNEEYANVMKHIWQKEDLFRRWNQILLFVLFIYLLVG
ncbi:hypothetical protein [Salipaludibacillus daqingensis]|uniref:hypothetical protein n=1 Tax=Salipaludibacillus daqingensis TaxID=3041001 RepID=UPI0024754628|nr:hypothetical protein [Salipaludibacillus daqingensis]